MDSYIYALQHELANWLTDMLQPVLAKYSRNLVKDTFEFCEHIEQFMRDRQEVQSMFMCSFDISSLFTNVPLEETIELCLDVLYRDSTVETPRVPENLLRKLLLKATSKVEFSFNGHLYKQIDGVAMGSPLGPVLANIFVGHLEASIPENEFPLLYDRFVDDTFAIFESEMETGSFFDKLNALHPNIWFTMEKEENGVLPFMDVRVEKLSNGLQRSVYRKPSFTCI